MGGRGGGRPPRPHLQISDVSDQVVPDFSIAQETILVNRNSRKLQGASFREYETHFSAHGARSPLLRRSVMQNGHCHTCRQASAQTMKSQNGFCGFCKPHGHILSCSGLCNMGWPFPQPCPHCLCCGPHLKYAEMTYHDITCLGSLPASLPPSLNSSSPDKNNRETVQMLQEHLLHSVSTLDNQHTGYTSMDCQSTRGPNVGLQDTLVTESVLTRLQAPNLHQPSPTLNQAPVRKGRNRFLQLLGPSKKISQLESLRHNVFGHLASSRLTAPRVQSELEYSFEFTSVTCSHNLHRKES